MKRFKILNVGPSTAETVELNYRMYVEILKYRGGKTLKQLVDEANNPKRWRGEK